MPDSNYIDQMAALIKQDPSITVKRLAQELKFADSKSIYYWLDKSNVGGIKEFRRLVLGKEAAAPKKVAHYLVVVPLLDWNPKQKNPGKEWQYVHSQPHPRGLFAIRVDSNRYSPWFLTDDVLIVSKGSTYPEGSWVLLKTKDEFVIGKVINKQIVDPVSLKTHSTEPTGVGRIIQQQRLL